MNQARSLYLGACELAADLLSDPMVAAAWQEPSALAKLSVRGLAGHLAGQVFFAEHMLAEPVPTQQIIGVTQYYARVSWIGSDIDDPFNQLIRTSGEQDAADGPAVVASRVRACVERLRTVLATAPNRPVRRPTWGQWSISFDDFLTTRLLEVVVHCDDLAYSVGVATPAFPAEAVETVVDLLSRIALRRHGATDVLRALSRAEPLPPRSPRSERCRRTSGRKSPHLLTVDRYRVIFDFQTLSLPGQFAYMAEESPDLAYLRWPMTAVSVFWVLCVQVVIVSTWKLLTLVKNDRIFSDAAFGWVNAIVGAIVAAWLVLLGVFLYVGFRADDPGLPLLLFLMLVGVAVLGLLMVVMRALLRQATSLRTDREAVI